MKMGISKWCLNGIGREVWEWVVSNRLASSNSPAQAGNSTALLVRMFEIGSDCPRIRFMLLLLLFLPLLCLLLFLLLLLLLL